MNISELFFNAAILNLAVFSFLYCAAYNIYSIFKRNINNPLLIISALFFAPILFIFIFSRELFKYKKVSIKNNLYTFCLASIYCILFFICFLNNNFLKNNIENLFLIVSSFNVLSGIILGFLLSILCKKIPFLHSVLMIFLISLAILTLSSFSDDIFSFGTSSAYFIIILLSLSFLLLLFLTIGSTLGYLFFGESRFNYHIDYESFIATRFLMSKKSSQAVSLITIISVIAVMISCAGMIIVTSVMNGFTDTLRSKILGANAHLMVLKYGHNFNEYQKIIDKTKSIKGVISSAAFILKEGMVSSEQNVSGAMIIGIDIDKLPQNHQLLKYIDNKTLENIKNPNNIPKIIKNNEEKEVIYPLVVVGKEMANDLGLLVGDLINFISPAGDIGPTGIIPRAKTFLIAGIFKSDMYEYDSKFAYMSLSDAQDFFNFNDTVTGIEYRLSELKNTRLIAQEIDALIGGYPYYVRDWMQMNRNIFSALQLEKIAMLIILATLIFMASLLILVTLIMVVIEKGKEIAILKSMGATDSSIMKVFVIYGVTVGLVGSLLGGLLGIIACLFIKKIGIPIDADIYYFSHIPILLEPLEVVLIIFAAIIISFLATISPSLFAAKLKPVDGLRYE